MGPNCKPLGHLSPILSKEGVEALEQFRIDLSLAVIEKVGA
jgi:hypothetical protein